MADKYKGKILVESDDWDFKDFRVRELEARIRELEADLADARLIAREQEDAQVSLVNELKVHERAKLEVRLDDLLRFLNAPGDWGYGTPMADLTLYLLKFRELLNRA